MEIVLCKDNNNENAQYTQVILLNPLRPSDAKLHYQIGPSLVQCKYDDTEKLFA